MPVGGCVCLHTENMMTILFGFQLFFSLQIHYRFCFWFSLVYFPIEINAFFVYSTRKKNRRKSNYLRVVRFRSESIVNKNNSPIYCDACKRQSGWNLRLCDFLNDGKFVQAKKTDIIKHSKWRLSAKRTEKFQSG